MARPPVLSKAAFQKQSNNKSPDLPLKGEGDRVSGGRVMLTSHEILLIRLIVDFQPPFSGDGLQLGNQRGRAAQEADEIRVIANAAVAFKLGEHLFDGFGVVIIAAIAVRRRVEAVA